jgi:hypothetical protein
MSSEQASLSTRTEPGLSSLSGLRLLTVSHRGFDELVHTGQLVNKNAAPAR